ncbi:protein-L-isoaspartate(D-aspartate) O-methyltransferase [Hyphococcus sp.]|uniref:protein-L-isoaspartate(D-aspartate) O-methyltransferase n=1 Tax=Hyphococcus sp. TaxID=2038636 RepID=UPI0035C6D651
MAVGEALSGERERMAKRHLAARAIDSRAVIEAMRETPREEFVPEKLREFAYEDTALPIDEGQTISQPYIVAKMLSLAEPGPGDHALEVGAGSGYAVAVLARLCSDVYAIERHKNLADAARERLARLGYDNVSIFHGDGARGLPEKAPFNVIIVSAGGADIPKALRAQLAIGGRLIIPVGPPDRQVLKRIRRTSETDYEEESFDLVQFVPLIAGETQGGDGPNTGAADVDSNRAIAPAAKAPQTTAALIADAAEPFDDLEELGRLAERFADRRVVMLGECTHGTAEFYEARARITERLVGKHGFTIVAVEADWPDAAAFHRYVRGETQKPDAANAFRRFPRWMWRNHQVYDFLHRLKAMNETKGEGEKAGFYGLDVYSLYASIEAVIDYLDAHDLQAAKTARERYGCLTPWCKNPADYGRMALSGEFEDCEYEVLRVLADMLQWRTDEFAADGDALFDATQNAHIVARAEEYYRAMYYGGAASWNLRDRHMFDTLMRLLGHEGPGAKAVVWAHNSHIGDARATEMGQRREEWNIGQLVREKFGDDAALVGFGSSTGSVAAASDWGGKMEIKTIRPARPGSFEGHCSDTDISRFLLDFTKEDAARARAALSEDMLERAIGVIYRPETEIASHYFDASPARQFDAWIWFNETRHVDAHADEPIEGAPETFPFGV